MVGFPFRVDVDDIFIDLDDATPVKAWLGYQTTPNGGFTASPDLPGNDPYLHGTWIEVAEIIRQITPTTPGYYTVFVEAFLNIATPPVPSKFKKAVYRSVTIGVVANT